MEPWSLGASLNFCPNTKMSYPNSSSLQADSGHHPDLRKIKVSRKTCSFCCSERSFPIQRKSLKHILLCSCFFFEKKNMSKIFPNHLIGTNSWAILGQDNVESTLTFNPVVLRWLAHIFLCTKVLLPQRGSFPERCVVEKTLVLWRQSPTKCGKFCSLPLNLSEHSHYWNRADLSFGHWHVAKMGASQN